MNKNFTSIFSFIFLFSVCGCDNNVTSSISSSANNNELKEALIKLKDNNYSIDYSDSFINNRGVEKTNKFYYTNYSFQSS